MPDPAAARPDDCAATDDRGPVVGLGYLPDELAPAPARAESPRAEITYVAFWVPMP